MSEAKKTTQKFETSSPVPRVPDGILLNKIFLKFLINIICHYPPVLINPGETQLMLMFFAYVLSANDFEKPIIPALEISIISLTKISSMTNY